MLLFVICVDVILLKIIYYTGSSGMSVNYKETTKSKFFIIVNTCTAFIELSQLKIVYCLL